MSSHASPIERLLAFSIIEDAPVASISPDYFFKKFEDPEEWDRLAREMDLYFFDRIAFFPFVERSRHHINLHHFIPRRGARADKYRHDAGKTPAREAAAEAPEAAVAAPEIPPQAERPHGPEPKERLVRPRRYFEIETELIERRFPADADIRGHLKTLRSYFCHNLIRYLSYKRLIFLLSVLLFWLLAFHYDALCRTFVGTFFPSLFAATEGSRAVSLVVRCLFIAGSFVVAALFDLALNSVLFDRFKHATEQSCFHVSTIAISRTERLRNCFDNCLKRIDEEQRQRSFSADLADRAGRWIVLVYWLAKRLEDFERFALVELWRIRRINFWINLAARAITIVVTAGLLALLALWFWNARAAGHAQYACGIVVVFVLTVVLAALNYATWKASVRLVRDSMKTADWARYADLELQEEFRHQIYKDKSEIVRWYAQFQGLVRGAH